MEQRFQAGGSVREGSFYVKREADEALYHALLAGEYCNVLAPRQTGKTSLAQRTARRLDEAGRRVAFVDLSSIGTTGVDANTWFCSVADAVGEQVGVDALAAWDSKGSLSPADRLLHFLRGLVADPEGGGVVIFFDEIDVALTVAYRDDFFGLIRSIYNAAARDPVCARLVFCMIGVVVPLDLTADPHRTPFNIGKEIPLDDLGWEEVQRLEAGLAELGAPPQALLRAVHDWTAGHPAMTQLLCARLSAQGPQEAAADPRVEAVVRATLLDPTSPDARVIHHIENYFEKLGQRTNRMLGLYQRILSGQRVPVEATSAVQIGLRRLGLVSQRREAEGVVLHPRNRVFAEVFNAAWAHDHENKHEFSGQVERWVQGDRQAKQLLGRTDIGRYERWAEERDDMTADEKKFLLESKSHLERRSRATTLVVGVLAAVMAAVIFIGARQVMRLLNHASSDVLALKRKLSDLRADYDRMEEQAASRNIVSEQAQRIGDDLMRVDDARLTATYRIVKHQYAAYAYMMTASALSLSQDAAGRPRIGLFADLCVSTARQGLAAFKEASGSVEPEKKIAAEWARGDDGDNRMHFLIAMCLSLKGAALNDEHLRPSAVEALEQLSEPYRKRVKPSGTRELAWICTTAQPPAACLP